MDTVMLDFHLAAEHLLAVTTELRVALLAENLPVFLPPEFPLYDQSPRTAATEALTLMNFTAGANSSAVIFDYPLSGLICVSQVTADLAESVTSARKVFKKAAIALKNVGKKNAEVKNNNSLAKLLSKDKLSFATRHPKVATGLQRIQLAKWNLLWCYRKVHLLEEGVSSLSWSWLRKRSDIISMSKAVAIDYAIKTLPEPKRQFALHEIEQSGSQHFARVTKPRPPQLKANVVIGEGKTALRKLIATPTVILLRADDLPRINWPGSPELERATRLKRSDNTYIRPLVRELDLYLASPQANS
jgi:hypothetical protein